jgi:hypothetical protein
MEPCPLCGNQLWGFMQQGIGAAVPTQPPGVPSSYVMVFPCEHRVWLPIPLPMSD